MNEQIINMKFVEEVKKHPCLYNHNLSEYSRRDVTEQAWSEVGRTVNLSGSQCKEKWKNIRAVFVRHLKPPPGSTSKKRKPYYLTEAMLFTIPYIKTLNNVSGSFPDSDHEILLKQDESDVSFNEHDRPVPSPPTDGTPHLPVPCHLPAPPVSPSPQLRLPHIDPAFKRRKIPKVLSAFDKTVMNYFNAKKARLEQKDDMDSRKMFLLSLLEDVRSMSDIQMRKFKRRVLDVLDQVLEETSQQPPLSSTSSHEPGQQLPLSSTSSHEPSQQPPLSSTSSHLTEHCGS